jgi:exonuclease III
VGQGSGTRSIKGSQVQPSTGPRQGSVGDVYGRLKYVQNATEEEQGTPTRRRVSKGWRLETQNVRGFSAESRRKWMGTWRRTPVSQRPQAWFLQETHVGSDEEANELAEMWKNMWGQKHNSNSSKMSYWSIDDTRAGGVAILLHPDAAAATTPWQQERWTKRVIAVTMRNVHMTNVYAPNEHLERESFFGSLAEWPWADHQALIAGDFNCVLSPILDR